MKDTILHTCSKRTKFTYTGSVKEGVTLHFKQAPSIEVGAELFSEAIKQFRGKCVRGGFSMDNAPKDGFGYWVSEFSLTSGRRLTPRHASFICAILQHEKLAECKLKGNAFYIDFYS